MNNSATSILIIDDELACLDQLKSSLASKEDEWILERSNNPQQALESIEQSPPSIVICDYRMPQMDGIELLRQVEASQPSVQRFIIADHDERGLLEAGIGSVFHYLPKPCPPKLLISEIQRALAVESWLGEERIRRIVKNVGTLPCLPPMYRKIVNALNNQSGSLDQVGKAISGDLAISVKILQIVNSSYFGFENTISDIAQAVTLLGIDTVKNLVLAIQVYGQDEPRELKSFTDQLWRHSLNVATAAKRIARYETNRRQAAEEAYTSGLFHDIGKLIIQRAAPTERRKALELAQSEGIPLWQAETEIVGCNHAETGAYLLARWGLPVTVVECAALHHDPMKPADSLFSPLVAVQAANTLVSKDGSESSLRSVSTSDESFLSEIGKSDSWSIWKEIVAGNDPLEPKPKSNENRNRDTPKDEPSFAPPPNESPPSITPPIPGRAPFVPRAPKRAEWNINALFTGFCVTICIAFASFLYTQSDSFQSSQNAEFESSQAPKGFDEALGSDSAFDSERSPSEPRPIAETETPDDEPEIAMREPVATEAEPPTDLFPKIRVSGIFYDLPRPAASINGKILRVGDAVSGAEIIAIYKGKIVIQHEAERRSFSLK